MLELEEESKFHFVDQQQQQKKINTKKNYQLTQEDLKPKRLLTTILQNSKVLFTTEQTITKTHNDNNNEQYNIHNQDNQFGKKIIKYKQFIVPKKLPTTILHSQRVNSTTNKQKMLNKNRNSQIRRLSNEESYSVRRNRSCTPILHKKYKHFLRFIEKTNKANSARNVKKNNKNNNSCYVNILQSNNYTRFNIKQNNSNNQKDQEEYYNLSKMYDSKYTTWKEQEKHKPNSKLLSSRSRRNAEKWNGGDKVQPWEQHNYNNYNIQENYCW